MSFCTPHGHALQTRSTVTAAWVELAAVAPSVRHAEVSMSALLTPPAHRCVWCDGQHHVAVAAGGQVRRWRAHSIAGACLSWPSVGSPLLWLAARVVLSPLFAAGRVPTGVPRSLCSQGEYAIGDLAVAGGEACAVPI